ncbi:MAG: hypothetical protein JWQ09_6026 [Segetibacter sp.]|nr:hypothetical protein [Segetibacter sp.]
MYKLFCTVIVLTVFAVFLDSCKHDIVPRPVENGIAIVGGTQPCSPDTVYFVNTVLPLIVQYCGVPGCHDAITHQDGNQFTSYETILHSGAVKTGKPDETLLYQVLNRTGSARMPKSQPPANYPEFTAQQKDIIKTWILQGAKNNACNDCDENNFTYTGAIAPLIANKCINCHSGVNVAVTGGNIRYGNYNQVKTLAETGKIISAITHAGTPNTYMPRGGNKLSDCEINQFKKWIANGYPN